MPGAWYPKRTATKPACAFPSWKSLPASPPDTGRRPANIKKKTSKDKSGPTGFPAGPFAFRAMAFSSHGVFERSGNRLAPGKRVKTRAEAAQAFGDERPLRTVWLLIG